MGHSTVLVVVVGGFAGVVAGEVAATVVGRITGLRSDGLVVKVTRQVAHGLVAAGVGFMLSAATLDAVGMAFIPLIVTGTALLHGELADYFRTQGHTFA